MKNYIDDMTLKAFSVSMKVGIVATIDEDDSPHLTILSTLQGKDDKTLIFGKFVEGMSKENIVKRPKAGFLVMNPEKYFWYGKMTYQYLLKEGEDYTMYNNQPLYRYNTYFGINTVYYADLVEISDTDILPMKEIVFNSISVILRKRQFKNISPTIMTPWAEKFTSKLDTLKFISFIDEDGYPEIIPIIQAQSIGSNRIVIKNKPFEKRLIKIKPGQKIAIIAFAMSMENILLKGVFSGFNQSGFGFLDIQQVYNSMPPVHKYIYPDNLNNEVLFDKE
jgi:hypothetical protein